MVETLEDSRSVDNDDEDYHASADEEKQLSSHSLCRPNNTAVLPVPKLGPEPVLLSRKEVDALYEILDAVRNALQTLHVNYIVTGGSLLGAIRQHSILFCDDDIDIAILLEQDNNNDDNNGNESDGHHIHRNVYDDVVVPKLQEALDAVSNNDFLYQIRPWEGGDRIRSKRINNVFMDLFVLRKYDNEAALRRVIGVKKNGQSQPEAYVQGILDQLHTAVRHGNEIKMQTQQQQQQVPLFPCWHFATRKAIEMWVKEVYKDWELFPLQQELKLGPLTGIQGPRTPVRLLKRAFGDDCFDVYYQSASHKETKKNGTTTTTATSSSSPPDMSTGSITTDDSLPPLTLAGGTWEGGQKAPLQDEHYLPMQPINRAKRRPTLHDKQQLTIYLEEQTAREKNILEKEVARQLVSEGAVHEAPSNGTRQNGDRPPCTVYMDGVFDLFHIGHLEAIQQCAKLGNRIIIGVTGDEDATGYKRRPIAPQAERVAIVESLSLVDQVVCPCPLIVTEAFMEELGIDLVVHGFANDADAERQKEFFDIPMKLGKFQRISYYHGLSTTDRINSIYRIMYEENVHSSSNMEDDQDQHPSANTKWFGASLAAATNSSNNIPTEPFPLLLRQVIEPHIEKARINRRDALDAIRMATGGCSYEEIMSRFRRDLAKEMDFQVPIESLRPLLLVLLESTSLPPDTDLSTIHNLPDKQAKDRLLHALTQNPNPFHRAFDEFVRTICVPRFAALAGEDCNTVYYQSFPCLRIVQPNEFSIGPHADVAYGHHPCSVNFYIPLTHIGGSSSLFLESRPGAEDWHSLEGSLGNAKHFAGATCMHWTTDNKTRLTRVSLDFRLIEGSMYDAMKCGGDHPPGGKMDVYRKTPGYYSKCVKEVVEDGGTVWRRVAPVALSPPDYRVGFPWTVKSWEKFWEKQNKQ